MSQMTMNFADVILKNNSSLTFYLVGFSDAPCLFLPLLVAFYMLFILTITGNSLIILMVSLYTWLQTPMYFFLCNLAFLDICYTSVTLPNLIWLHSWNSKSMPFTRCISQQYFYISFAVSEYFLLSAMAYDRYVAICNPLRYSSVITRKMCLLLAEGCWLTGFISSLFPVSISSQFDFCKSKIINHFFCDLTALLKLSCGSTAHAQVLIFVESIILGLMPFIFTLGSYVAIVHTIKSIHSHEGQQKAFSTCVSHLTVVVLFYGTMIGVYMRPASMYSPAHDKLFALLYTSVIPMVNPIIYTLRNNDVKRAMRKSLDIWYKVMVGVVLKLVVQKGVPLHWSRRAA